MFKFLVLTLGIISCQVYAEDTLIVNDHDISAIKDCWQKNSDDDTDINVIKSCLRQEYNLVDAQLNKAYGEAYRYIEQVPRTGVKKTDTEQLNLLKKSQRAWLDFRDKECELILSNEDVQDLSDPYSESEWLSCMIIQTNTRTRQLQLYRNSEDFYPSPLTRG